VAQKRLSMRKIRETLRLKNERGLSNRQIARSLKVSHSTVADYLRRAREAGLSWPIDEELDEEHVEALLFPPPRPSGTPRPMPDWASVHRELGGHKGTTLALLWLEYKQAQGDDGYQYSQFCELYRRWRGALDVVLRQPYHGGEKLLVDYAGPTVPIVDPHTGEVREALVFVGALGASNYTFIDLTWTKALPDWIDSHIRMFEFIGGVPQLVIPDNERSGVRKASRYEPDLNPTYHDLAVHYGTTVLPTRPRSPRDKAKAEAAVQNVERWVLAPLRRHTFFALAEARDAVAPLWDRLNVRPFQKLEATRRSLFEELDRPALGPLPPTRFEFGTWRKARVNIDYHIQVERRFYSVPYALARREVEARLTATTLEIYFAGRRVAVHPCHAQNGRYSTNPDHMPPAHRAHLEWTPERLITWGRALGPDTATFIEELIESRPHAEQAYRSCLGLMSLARTYPAQRIDAACRRALTLRALSYRSVKSILRSGLDRAPQQQELELRLPPSHDHVRGPDYYRSTLNPEGD
jgi:transposase